MTEVSATIGAMIVHAAARAGADVSALCLDAGFEPRLAVDPDARIPIAIETALWDGAAAATRDPAFGIHAAESLRPGAFDVLDYAVRTAPTLRASIERLARYNRLVHDAAVFTLTRKEGRTRIEHSLGPVRQSPHAAEFTLAALVVIGEQLSGEPLLPLVVELRHPRSVAAPLAEHLRRFGVEPRFAASVNAIELADGDLDRSLPAFDPALSRVIERNAERLLAERPAPSESTADRVRRLLIEALAQDAEAATLTTAAARFRMSERSLQRKLADEGVSFDALLDELRHDLALRYLGDPKISIAETAYLLGYSEPSAFHRAFKRWTGNTPSQARGRAA